MIAAHRRRIEKNDREKIFVISHAADFPKNSPVDLISAEIDARVAEFLARDQAFFSVPSDKAQVQAQEVKGDTRDLLIDNLLDIVTGADAVGADTIPDVTGRFRMPHPRTDENLQTAAEKWFEETAPYENLFVGAGLDADFRRKLLDAKNDFQKACAAAGNIPEEHRAAFREMDLLMQEIMNLSRRRAALVKLKYKYNPGKLAAWSIAAYLDHPPKKKLEIVMQMI
ncbi:MAG TPA: hypothetical protein VIL74_13045 [Pyrinomonadaceae bacterium]|jgi:hypothetical protein